MARKRTSNLAEAIRRRMTPIGGVELEDPVREPVREPAAISEISLKEVAGRLKSRQKAKTVAEMNAAVEATLRRRRDRY